jgi:hypothetical protein
VPTCGGRPSERGDRERYWDGGIFMKSLKRGTILGSIGGRKNKIFRFEAGDLTVLEYERRFQNLSAFASTYLPLERYRVERFRDGLR